jgi:hypothetical protein
MSGMRQAGVIFLVILVLVGTTGFTWWHHICACKPVVEVKVASCCEPVKETQSCCEKEALRPVKKEDACGTGCSHDHKGCKDVPLYFKASIVAVPQVSKAVIPELAAASELDLPYITESSGETATFSLAISHDKPPPLAGKALVFFLNQLRIPFSA